MRHVLALDQGATSSRALLFDEERTPVSVAQREFGQIFPQPGWDPYFSGTKISWLLDQIAGAPSRGRARGRAWRAGRRQ